MPEARGLLLHTSLAAREAVDRVLRYHDTINDSGVWSAAESATTLVLQWLRSGERTLGHRAANEMTLASWVHVARTMLGRSVPILGVRFSHPPPRDTRAHDDFFGVSVQWSAPDDALVLGPRMLDVQPLGADALVSRRFEDEVAAELAKVHATMPVERAAARYVFATLPDHVPTGARVAAHLGTSERTLRRRLASAGTSLAELVASAQRTRADALLRSGAAVGETAYAIGFANVGAFTRAYRRWTGEAPKAIGTRSGSRSPR